MIVFLSWVLVVSAVTLLLAASGRIFVDPKRKQRTVMVAAIILSVAVFGLLGLAVQYSDQLNRDAAMQARRIHEKHLAWQRGHPKEYAAQVARHKAQVAREDVQRRAARGRQQASQREAQRVANLPENKAPCDYAGSRVSQGWADFKAGAYQSAFDNAVKGLAVNDRCDDDDAHLVNQGFLLSVKGMSEHYLSSGDARTDLNQAETVLEECQTNPRLYGTHTGATCETQQENDISATTDWDVGN
jgi:Tfp pilus assembly protein PilV